MSTKVLCSNFVPQGPPSAGISWYQSPHIVVAVSDLDSHSDSHTRIVLSLWQPWTLLRTSVPNLPPHPMHGDHPLGGCAYHRGCGLYGLAVSAYREEGRMVHLPPPDRPLRNTFPGSWIQCTRIRDDAPVTVNA